MGVPLLTNYRNRRSSRAPHFLELPTHYETNSDNDFVLNSIIAWSFYPKLLKSEGKGWRNVSNNQSISVHPSSVNKGHRLKWLSFYHVMQSSNKRVFPNPILKFRLIDVTDSITRMRRVLWNSLRSRSHVGMQISRCGSIARLVESLPC